MLPQSSPKELLLACPEFPFGQKTRIPGQENVNSEKSLEAPSTGLSFMMVVVGAGEEQESQNTSACPHREIRERLTAKL